VNNIEMPRDRLPHVGPWGEQGESASSLFEMDAAVSCTAQHVWHAWSRTDGVTAWFAHSNPLCGAIIATSRDSATFRRLTRVWVFVFVAPLC